MYAGAYTCMLKDPEATECIQSILLQADLLLLVKKKILCDLFVNTSFYLRSNVWRTL